MNISIELYDLIVREGEEKCLLYIKNAIKSREKRLKSKKVGGTAQQNQVLKTQNVFNTRINDLSTTEIDQLKAAIRVKLNKSN